MKFIKFAGLILRDYKIGAITISTKYVADAVASICVTEGNNVIEYGAGDGVITQRILDKISSNGRITALEINKNLISELLKIKDARLDVRDQNVLSFLQAFQKNDGAKIDAVASGIPFTFIKSREREEIVKLTHFILRDGGVFVVYQYSTLLLPLLKKYFSNVSIKYEVRNLPPYFIMRAEK